ncbi:MAG TPA: TRAM domain-containing protein [Chthoniobacterales bacterium]|jgi:tRNA/tmRNA/rRNA uracil-C5-methylase (TrmA/RlmC/RlmD family)|nr:TRAM domain-containing protein [Chthoniobacterales bacterium]
MRTVDLQIEDIAFGGKGVAREHGKAVFVSFTVDGELVSAKITREKKHFAEAEAVGVRKASPHRVDPRCPYFGQCGGCAYQHIDYAHQLEIKSRQVCDLLQRIGKLKDVSVRPIVPSPLEYAYRNRITVHAENGVIGYFRRDSHRLIDIERCPIAMDEVNRELIDLRTRNVPDGHYTLRAKGGARIFTQTNDGVANALQDLIVNLVPPNQELLVDAYCGAGFFAKAMVDKFERVIGIDWDRFAIGAAKENATAKETYVAGNVESALCLALENCDPDTTVLLVDPPATGLTTHVRETIADAAPATLIYISCNPSTLARDLGDFQRRFEIRSVTPLDMFPQTAEIEVVAELRRRD